MIICFPKMFLPIGSNFLPIQSKEDHFTPYLPFLIFVFIAGSLNKTKVLPCNMVDILCTFCDCSLYNFITFFLLQGDLSQWVYYFFMQQLDDVILITPEYFNFKRKFKWKFPAVRNRYLQKKFNLVPAALLLFYSHSNYSSLQKNSDQFLLVTTLQQCLL